MTGNISNEPMLEMYIFETTQNIEQLELCIIDTEKSSCYTQNAINEIFRIMHTIKGSSAMMLFNNIATLAHSIEDLFYFLRENKPSNIDCSALSDLILESVDFIKVELQKIIAGKEADGENSGLCSKLKEFLNNLKSENGTEVVSKECNIITNINQICTSSEQTVHSSALYLYKATVFFEDGCEMENIRAYNIIHNLKESVAEIFYYPKNIIDNDNSVRAIREEGFKIILKTKQSFEEMKDFFQQIVFMKDLELEQIESENEYSNAIKLLEVGHPVKLKDAPKKNKSEANEPETPTTLVNQSIISVNVSKLDKLMDLVGELVTAEAMVTQNPEIIGLNLDSFQKSSRQLHKITSELQDIVMSIRMVPLSITFQKMHRIIRDMSKKLNKEVELELIGEETEVDKNIIEHISDPLMHLVRNAIDHGIEDDETRNAMGKPKAGKITLEAKNAESEVIIVVKDDGKGLSKEKIIEIAKKNDLLTKPENEMTEQEIYKMILIPGFSTRGTVSEYSGRGVGMDVVVKNIEEIGGSVSIESIEGYGSTITLKLPLTLAIIDGMNVKVGKSSFTIPTMSIKQSFRPSEKDIIKDPDGNEMILVRGKCYPIIRLHKLFKLKTQKVDCSQGILIMIEQDDTKFCIFADELLGQQQVVVKTLPQYIRNIGKIQGLTGCTLLGDGSISLILDVGSILKSRRV